MVRSNFGRPAKLRLTPFGKGRPRPGMADFSLIAASDVSRCAASLRHLVTL